MNWRMIKAEWLKLRKRRGLFWWSLGLAVGVVTLIFGVIEVLHLSNAAQHGPAGGLTGITRGLTGLYAAGGVAAIIVGAFAGTADVSAGVFRDLVATGRSRWELFAARLPGALIFFIPIITLGYVVVAVCSVAFRGSVPAASASVIARGYGWVLLATGFDLAIALGFSSFTNSRAATIGVLIAWQFIASQLLLQVSWLGWVRQLIYSSALTRLNPSPALEGPGSRSVTHSAAVAAVVLLAWVAVMLAAGCWRTVMRDA
jgi:ABC-type transport system involved in multi-copper enzyme maturation permease subunit